MADTMIEMKTLTVGDTTFEIVDEKARSEKISLPKDNEGNVVYGNDGQILKSNGDGTTEWIDDTGGGTDSSSLGIGYWSDGKLYLFVNGVPVGNGVLVSDIDNIQLTDIVSYYQEPTQTVADEVNALGDEYVSFVIVTDTHQVGNMNNSQNIIRYLLKNTKANRLFHLGDVVSNNWSESDYKTYFAPFENCIPQVFFALGNHELQAGTMEDVSVIYEDLLANKSYLKGNPESFYYYFDDTTRKIRYLVINTSDGMYNGVTSEQATWIEESVQLPTDEWKLIVFGHIDIMPNDTITNEWNSNSETLVTNALCSTNGTIIGYFCGHEHFDRIVKVNDIFYQINLLNDTCSQDTTFEEITNPTRTAGTVSEQAVSVVCINTNTGNVIIKRIGAGENMNYSYPIGTEEPTDKTLSSISATYTGGDVAVGTASTDLTGITVTATYSDGSTKTITDYTLSGEIVEGENTITVTYEGLTATFKVTGIVETGEPEEYENWTDGVPYEFEFVENKYIDSDGNYVEYDNWGTTPFLPCYGASTITFTAISGTTASVGVSDSAFYGEDKKKVSSIYSFGDGYRAYPSEENPITVSVPATAYYVVLSGNSDTANNGRSIYNLVATPNA